MIDDVIKPSRSGKLEVTSWTKANSFEKYGLDFYVEEFYTSTPSTFSLRLLPFGKHSNEDIKRLNEIVGLIDQNLQPLLQV